MMEISETRLPSNNNRRAHACKVCGKEGYLNNIKDHIEANHLEGISLPCKHCDNFFRSRSSLRHHNTKQRTYVDVINSVIFSWYWFFRARNGLRRQKAKFHNSAEENNWWLRINILAKRDNVKCYFEVLYVRGRVPNPKPKLTILKWNSHLTFFCILKKNFCVCNFFRFWATSWDVDT